MNFTHLYSLACTLILAAGSIFAQPAYNYQRLKQEQLGRGFVAIREDPNTVHLSWRYLTSDSPDIAFDLYRDGQKINREPLQTPPFY